MKLSEQHTSTSLEAKGMFGIQCWPVEYIYANIHNKNVSFEKEIKNKKNKTLKTLSNVTVLMTRNHETKALYLPTR